MVRAQILRSDRQRMTKMVVEWPEIVIPVIVCEYKEEGVKRESIMLRREVHTL